MNTYSVIAAGVIAGAATCLCAPATAHGGTEWSVTVQSQPYYQSPPPVFYPQSPYPYGPPPSAFPPPQPPVYQYQYQEPWPAQQYRDHHGQREHSWRERESRERGRQENHSRHRGQDNDRPGANKDLPRWGYRDQHQRR